MPSPLTVLYVLGKGRSGSTLIDGLLGQLPGVFSTGELRYLWEWGYLQGFDCSCGARVDACPVWAPVVERTLGTAAPSRAQVRELVEVQERVLSWSAIPGLLTGGRIPGLAASDLRAYVSVQSALYRAVADVTGADVVVDSSKWPAHPGVLGQVHGVTPRLLHLVRDPRAVAYSYRRHKRTSGRQPEMPRFGVAYSALSWLARNAVVETVRRRVDGAVTLTYERFVAAPRDTLAEVARLLDRGNGDLPFAGPATAVMGETHLVGGNPDRFRSGEVTIEPDLEWEQGLDPRSAWVVTAITRPLLGRYGYPTSGARG